MDYTDFKILHAIALWGGSFNTDNKRDYCITYIKGSKHNNLHVNMNALHRERTQSVRRIMKCNFSLKSSISSQPFVSPSLTYLQRYNLQRWRLFKTKPKASTNVMPLACRCWWIICRDKQMLMRGICPIRQRQRNLSLWLLECWRLPK